MSEDLISNNFTDNINRNIVKRNFSISRILLALSVLWSSLILLDWYRILKGGSLDSIKGVHMVYTYVILPLLDTISIVLTVYCYMLLLKAYRRIEEAIEDNNGILMSESFDIFYTVNVLTVICYIISIFISIMNFIL